MAGWSNYLREAVLNWIGFGTAFPAAPATIYISLHTGDPGITGANEVSTSGTGYARVAKTVGATNFLALIDDGADELLGNKTNVAFGTATASWGTITHFGIWSAATAGNFYGSGPSTNKLVGVGDSYTFNGHATDATQSGMKLKSR